MIDQTIADLNAWILRLERIEDKTPIQVKELHTLKLASMGLQCGQVYQPHFDGAWSFMRHAGYQYGHDALEQVKLGFELRGLFK